MAASSAEAVTDPEVPELELRCPEGWGICQAGRLLAKLRLSGERPSYVHPDNLIEMQCPDCVKRLRREGRKVARVLHRFDFLGDLVETLVVDGPRREGTTGDGPVL